jgi:hypothetical protein
MWTKWARPQAEWAKGPAGQLGFEVVRLEPWLPRVYMRRKSPSRWRKLVEAITPGRSAMWLGRTATTWLQTDLSKLMEVLFARINTPPHAES